MQENSVFVRVCVFCIRNKYAEYAEILMVNPNIKKMVNPRVNTYINMQINYCAVTESATLMVKSMQ